LNKTWYGAGMSDGSDNTTNQRPEGYYVSLGMAMGIPVGIGIGAALGNVGMGPAIGVALGVGAGAAWEAKAKKEERIRALTPEERARKRKSLWVALTIGVLVGAGILLTYFFVR
jgi:predicted MFS family arabinose efflux permease